MIIIGNKFRVIVYMLSNVWKIISFSNNMGNLSGLFGFCFIRVMMVIVRI